MPTFHFHPPGITIKYYWDRMQHTWKVVLWPPHLWVIACKICCCMFSKFVDSCWL